MVAGDLVNTASRLQGAAPAGTVLVGRGHAALDQRGHCLRRGRRATAEGQGRAGAAPGAPCGSRRPAAGPAAAAPSSRRSSAGTRSCGWSRTCSTPPGASASHGWYRSSVRRASASSRLAWEFEKYLDGISETGYWHAGRSPAYGEGISFWALGEMVRERAQIAEGIDADEARRLLDGQRQRMGDRCRGAALDRAAAGRPAGLDPMPAGEKEELFAAWRTFFERMADRRTR